MPVDQRLALRIADLKPGMRDVLLEAEVIEVSAPKVITARGSERTILEATISDETGRIKLVLWDDKIIELRPGDKIIVSGGAVTSFKGEWRLNVSRGGKIERLRSQKST